jgi:hypothetical protein
MAASFLLAMVVVDQVRQRWRADRVPGIREDAVAEVSPPARTPTAGTEPADRDASSPGWRLVTLGIPGAPGQGARSIDLPAFEADRLDESMLNPGPHDIPNELRDALQRLGYEVRQHRQLLPMPLRDGRRLVVPVDRVEFHPVGNPTFQ